MLGRPMRRTLLIAAAAIPLPLLVAVAACSGTNMTGGDVCGTCASIYVNGGIVCGPGDSNDAWQMLDNCACGDTCIQKCLQGTDGGANLCTCGAADSACNDCIMNNCAAPLAACAAN
jgi:hypothetical protein